MIHIRAHSGMYTLEATQTLPISLAEAWAFFSTPGNLAKITPDYMGFQITSHNTDRMYRGQIITYTIGLLPGIRSSWVTEITEVQEQRLFIDEQRFGPYAMWHHEHWFEEKNGQVHTLDRVSYKLPLGLPGRLASPFIKKQLHAIFAYRQTALEQRFPN